MSILLSAQLEETDVEVMANHQYHLHKVSAVSGLYPASHKLTKGCSKPLLTEDSENTDDPIQG